MAKKPAQQKPAETPSRTWIVPDWKTGLPDDVVKMCETDGTLGNWLLGHWQHALGDKGPRHGREVGWWLVFPSAPEFNRKVRFADWVYVHGRRDLFLLAKHLGDDWLKLERQWDETQRQTGLRLVPPDWIPDAKLSDDEARTYEAVLMFLQVYDEWRKGERLVSFHQFVKNSGQRSGLRVVPMNSLGASAETAQKPAGDTDKQRPGKQTLQTQIVECGTPGKVWKRYYEGKFSRTTVYNWADAYTIKWDKAKEARADLRQRKVSK